MSSAWSELEIYRSLSIALLVCTESVNLLPTTEYFDSQL